MKLARAAAATLGFVLLLCGIYLAHARWFTVDVVFYAALTDVVIALLLAAAALWSLRWFAPLDAFERVQLMAIWGLLGYAAAITGPALIDRSLSFYILEKLVHSGGGVPRDRFERLLVDEFMAEYRVAHARLTEQLASGTIRIADGCILITPEGRRLAGWSKAFRNHVLPRRRLLMGVYTDALTDPVGRSAPQANDCSGR